MDKQNFSDRVWLTLLCDFIARLPVGAAASEPEAAAGAFLGFLRENSEILDTNATLKWVESMQEQYPQEQLLKHFQPTTKH